MSSPGRGAKSSIVNPTDAVTKDNTVSFSALTHVNKIDCSDSCIGADVGMD